MEIIYSRSFDLAVAELQTHFELTQPAQVSEFDLQLGAAIERICEEPLIGRSLGSVLHSHRVRTFPFAVIYEVTDDDLCFLHIARTRA